jgi:hypothetical protein
MIARGAAMTLGRSALVLTVLLSPVVAHATEPATVAYGNGPSLLTTDRAHGAPGRSVVVGRTVRRAEPAPAWRGNATGSPRSLARAVVFAQSPADESFYELQQSVVPLAGGGFGVVWVEGDFPARDVRMQWLDPSGNAVFPAGGRVVAGGPANQADPVIAAHPTAGAFVAFTEDNTVRVQAFDGAGSPRWPGGGVTVADKAPDEVLGTPHVVASPDDGVFVCFEYSGAGPRIDIRCQHVDDTGARRWGTTGVSVGNGGDADLRVLPRGVADGAGGVLLFWRNQRRAYMGPDVSPMLMEGQHFDSQGFRLWGSTPKVVRTTRLASSNGYGYSFFQVAADGSWGAVLAFDDWTGGADRRLDVMAQRVSSAGDLLWGEGAVVTGASGHQQHEQTIGAPDGGAFVAVSDVLGPDHDRLLLFRLAPDGTQAWASEGVLLSDPAATALDYSVHGSFDDGFLRLGWTHQRFPATFEFDVQFAAYTLAGERRGGAAGLSLTGAPGGQFLRGLAYSPGSAGVLAVWDDESDATGAALADRFWRWRSRFMAGEPRR